MKELKNKIRIKITQEDIDKANVELLNPNNFISRCCPTFYSLQRLNYNVIWIGLLTVNIVDQIYNLSKPLQKQVDDYTWNKNFKPGVYCLYKQTETNPNLRE